MFQDQKDINAKKEMFYLTMHSKHFYLQLYCIGHMVKNQSDSEREKPAADTTWATSSD